MSTKVEKCLDCNKDVITGEKAMQCDICMFWHHIACVSIPDALYKSVDKFENSKTGSSLRCIVRSVPKG